MSDKLRDLADQWLRQHTIGVPDGYADASDTLTAVLKQARAQGRQEGFAEARERAAKVPEHWNGPVSKSDWCNAQSIAAQQIMARIRALQPTNEKSSSHD